MDIQVFNRTQTNILLALAQFKFLVSSQMVTLGIMSHSKNINKQIKRMRERNRPPIKSIEFAPHPKYGKLPYVHCLTNAGKRLLMSELDIPENEIRLPIGHSSLVSTDYFHRKYTLDFHVAAASWAKQQPEMELLFFDRYFDKLGNNRTAKNLRAKTKIDLKDQGYLIADGVFQLLLPNGEGELYCFEMYDGSDTLRTLKQLKKHIEAIEIGSVSDKYQLNYAHRVLCLFELEGHQKAVIKRAQQDAAFAHMKPYFLSKHLGQLTTTDFASDWLDFEGNTIPIF